MTRQPELIIWTCRRVPSDCGAGRRSWIYLSAPPSFHVSRGRVGWSRILSRSWQKNLVQLRWCCFTPQTTAPHGQIEGQLIRQRAVLHNPEGQKFINGAENGVL